MKRVLMAAFHYPPAAGTSGVQRALRFSQYLPGFGWDPIVLTAHERAYAYRSADQLATVPENIPVIRSQAWDAMRHLSIKGRYPTALALPDRWSSWRFDGIRSGLKAIRQFRPDAIWSTYPIATAHHIASVLAEKSGLPLVADFRDPMAQEGYPEDPRVWRSFERVEKRVVSRASICTFTTPSALRMYQARYPDRQSSMRLLENGFEESVFQTAGTGEPLVRERFTLLHSGIVYPSERDPTSLFEALARLKESDSQLAERLVVRFRASGHDDLLRQMAQRYGVEPLIEVADAVPYADAISEMCAADALLILQASNCNAQIPAKLYEYFRAGPPVFLVTDPEGDTAEAAGSAGVRTCAIFGNPDSIVQELRRLLQGNADGMRPDPAAVERATREARTQVLAGLLDEAAGATASSR